MNILSYPAGVPPHGESLLPAAPQGWQFALIRHEANVLSQRRGDIIKFDDSRNESIPKFKYERLSNIKENIRLLKLMAGKQDTPDVECQLFEAQLQRDKAWRINDQKDGPRLIEESYEALSWSWGSEPPEYQILVRKGEGRTRLKASATLVWALKYLRRPDRDRTLWIDAICINQQSVDEKNHQVQMMSQIYSFASNVCIWLGLDDVESHMAITFIKDEILQLQHFDKLCEDEANSRKWQSLLLLMQRPWFFRRWVVQEIALAKDAMIYCGPDTISWKDFSVAVELFVEVETATHRLSEVMKKDPKFYHVPGWFEFVSALGASRLVEATGMIYRYYKEDVDEPAIEIGPGTEKKSSTSNGEGQKTGGRQRGGPDVDSGGETNDEEEEEDEEENVAGPSTAKKPSNGEGSTTPADDGAGGPSNSEGAKHQVGTGDVQDSGGSTTTSEAAAVAEPGDRDELAMFADPISSRRELLTLENLVSRLSIFQAAEPRDAIYALLAIAKDAYPRARSEDLLSLLDVAQGAERRPFLVDYGRAYPHVCQDFIRFCVTAMPDESRALDIICRPWAPEPASHRSVYFHPKIKTDDEKKYWKRARALKHKRGWLELKDMFPKLKDEAQAQEPKLPTWIPKLSGAPFSMYYQAGMDVMKMGRVNADPLVGDPLLRRNYDAAQSRRVDTESLHFKSRRLYRGHSMFVKGFIFDSVLKVADSSQSGNIPADWLEIGGWSLSRGTGNASGRSQKDHTDHDVPEPPEAFWRTLVANRGKDGQNPPYYYARACKESVAKGGVASGAVSTADLINNERNSIVAQFCRRVQAVIWNRSLISTAQGNLGIANKHVRPGDYVAVLYGCSVPVILRRKEKKRAQMDEEAKEEEYTEKAERCWRYVTTGVKLRKRRQWWEKLPDKPSEDKKWGKENIREWRQQYIKLMADQAKKGQGKAQQAAKPEREKQQAPLQEPQYYYEFLGECYIHGMMDGEAVARKARWTEPSRKDEKARLYVDMIFELR